MFLFFLSCSVNEVNESSSLLFDLDDPVFTITPEVVHSTDTINVAADQLSELRLQWYRNGEEIVGQSSSQLLPEYFKKSDVISLDVFQQNGDHRSQTVTTNIFIHNTAPTGEISLQQTEFYTDENIHASVDINDYDFDEVIVQAHWKERSSEVEFEGITLVPDYTQKGQNWTLSITLYDGEDYTPLAPTNIEIIDSPTELYSISILPESPRTSEILFPSIEAFDLDNDDISLYQRWLVNGVLVSEEETLSPALFFKEDEITLEASLQEDFAEIFTSETISAINTAPVIDALSISPSPAFANSELQCDVIEAIDDDQDELVFLTSWFINGVLVSNDDILDPLQHPISYSDLVTCQKLADDGEELSFPRESSAVIQNTAPTVLGAQLSESEIFINSTLECIPQGIEDIDAQSSFIYYYQWYLNGSYISNQPVLNIGTISDIEVGDSIHCTVRGSDGLSIGAAVASGSAEIQNRPPSATIAAITPSTGYVDSDFSCTLFNFQDLDDNEDQSTYQWLLNGVEISTEDSISFWDEQTGLSTISIGDQLSCVVTPSDGIDTITPISISIEIQNKPPEILNAYITPSAPPSTITLQPTVIAQDIDQEEISYNYQWYVNGIFVSSESSLSPSYIERYDQVQLSITPSSSGMLGAAYITSAVSIGNAPPELAEPEISPLGARESIDNLYCYSLNEPIDPDGDEVILTYSWIVNGSSTMYTTDTIPATELQAGDVWVCLIRATDPEGAGRTASTHQIIRRQEPIWIEIYNLNINFPFDAVFTSETPSSQILSEKDGSDCWNQLDLWSAITLEPTRSLSELEAVEAAFYIEEPDSLIELVTLGESYTHEDLLSDGIANYAAVRLRASSPEAAEIRWGDWQSPYAEGTAESIDFSAPITTHTWHTIRLETDALLGTTTILLDGSIVLQTDQVPFLDLTNSLVQISSSHETLSTDVCWKDVKLLEGSP